jgi:hypothetical protein
VGVDHGSVDAPMAEPLRDLVDAHALHHQVAGKGVSERVKGEVWEATGVDYQPRKL